MIGIYKIISPTGKVYIGQSINIENRFKSYKRLSCKAQTKLYNSLKKYGVKKHKFEIIHICDIKKLNELEKYYVDLFQTFNSKHGLNLKDGGGSRGLHSDDSKEKNRIAHLGKVASIETREKSRISRTGGTHSVETREKLRIANIGKKATLELRIKLSDIHRSEPKKAGCSSKYKGVSFDKNLKKYRSVIFNIGKKIHIGYFENELDAHNAYENKLIELKLKRP